MSSLINLSTEKPDYNDYNALYIIYIWQFIHSMTI